MLLFVDICLIALLVVVCIVLASAVYNAFGRLRDEVRTQRRSCAEFEQELDAMARRLVVIEDRLNVLGAPQTAADLKILQRLIAELLANIQRLADQNDEDNWWKRGETPPY